LALTDKDSSELPTGTGTAAASGPAAIIYVCITCRGPGGAEIRPLPGELLAAATARAALGSGVEVRAVRCLANCSRGPSAAMRRNGSGNRNDSWTYIFGGLDAAHAPALVLGARMLAQAADGILPWRGRPDVLKRGLIGRVPPLDYQEDRQ
jgi:predicted metal-binding protein